MSTVSDEVFRIDLALSKSGGDRGKAATLLAMERRVLSQRIKDSTQLRERWSKPDQPQTPAVMIDREPLKFKPRGFRRVATDQEIEAALRREDDKFEQGLQGLSLEAKEMELAINLQKFQRRHFKKAADLIGGGISMAALKLLGLLDDLGKRLKKENSFTGESALAEEAMCWESYLGICAELRKMGHFVAEAGFKKALIELRQAEMKQGTARGRPGFGPLQAQKTEVNVQMPEGGQLSVVSGQ